MRKKDPVYVTRPSLPPLDKFVPYLERIWETKWLTNAGPFHDEFELKLARYLGVKHLALFANATVALIVALKALKLTGEVITTPYSFVATAHSLLWNNIRPVFVDIDPLTLNLDPRRIEEAITPNTTGIMPVHVYGSPCDVEQIQKIASAYGLKVIYDAAHAFGVTVAGRSVLTFGDLSVLSFHATKVFNTFEGGAIICPDAKAKQHIDYLKNFGFADEVTVVETGINGKMNEFQAALGLLQLEYIDEAVARRRQIDATYRERLANVHGLRLLPSPAGSAQNFSYFPVLVGPNYPLTRDELYERLKRRGFYARRYFYPLISEFPMYRSLASAEPSNLPVATRISRQILCLPIFDTLDENDIAGVVGVIKGA